MPFRRRFLSICLLLAGCGVAENDNEPIPDKVGAEIHLTKQERSALKKLECGMCKAIISEMHEEVSKHDMTRKGEDHVWETSNAMCLALLQRYKLQQSSGGSFSLEPKGEDEDMEMAADPASGQQFMRNMLVLKMGCQLWLEDYGSDTSGFVFKSVKDGVQPKGEAAKQFCVRDVSLCGSGKKERKKREKDEKERLQERSKMVTKQDKQEAKERKDDPLSALPEDSKLGLQQMLEMARDDPLHYMEQDAKDRIRKARSDLRCEVCRTVLQEAYVDVSKKPKSLRGENEILEVMEKSCEGGADLSVPSYFGVTPPPLPPPWTDRWRPRLEKKTGLYALKRFPKKAAKDRQKWRKLSADGKQQPPSAADGESDLMLTLTCRDMLEAESLSTKLFEAMSSCEGGQCEPVERAAATACSQANSQACSFAKTAATSEL